MIILIEFMLVCFIVQFYLFVDVDVGSALTFEFTVVD